MLDRIDVIKKYGKEAQGRNELLKHLSGGKLTKSQAVKAKCYECESYYQDGKQPCSITTCPLQPFNRYRVGGVAKDENRSRLAKQRFANRVKNARFSPE